jgi:dihydropyrimidine dehydrogenase (NADP+)
VQNQDFTVITDYLLGLKTLLYLRHTVGDDWDGQSPPTPQHQRGKPVTLAGALQSKEKSAIPASYVR